MLRAWNRNDINQLLAIEENVSALPWGEEAFKTCMAVGYLGWVKEIEKRIAGFILMSVKGEESHILNIAVAKKHQRQGLGLELMHYAMQQAKQKGAGIIYLEVRVSNASAIAMYKKLQFHEIGQRKNYYPIPSGYEDALVFGRSLGG